MRCKPNSHHLKVNCEVALDAGPEEYSFFALNLAMESQQMAIVLFESFMLQ